MEPPSIVADEVALEGLDGITIPSLWIRLEDRRPKFPLKLDDCTKGFIWSYLVSNVDFRFYELPQERENIELFDRFKGLDPDTGVEKETLSSQHRDVYPIHVIPENKDGIQGSCAFFKQRKDITKKLRSQSLTPVINLEEALKMYGRKLVVVASQALRFRTLIGPESDPDLKLSSDSYCVLERVGRARWQGELQRDLHGGLFKADARKLHYLRKSLVIHDLITMQSYVRRLHSGQRQHSVLLLLKRFHISRRSKYDLLMESMSTFLQELPSQFSTVDMLKEHLNVTEPNLKRLFNYMRAGKFVQFCHYPLEDLCPSAGPCKNKNGSKVLVRCVKLLKPYTKKSVPEEEEDEDDEDEEDYSGARKGGGVPTVGRIMERDVLYQAYDFILSSGTKGVSQRDLSSRLNISLLESRITWRKLVKDGMVKPFMEDVGRQRMRKFISHKFVGVSDKIQKFAKEQARKNQLFSAELPALETDPASPKTPGTSKAKPSARRVKKALVKKQQVCDDSREDVGDGICDGERGKTEDEDSAAAEETQLDVSIMGTTQAEAWTGSTTSMTPDSVSVPPAEKAADEEQQSTSANSMSQTEADDAANKILNVDGVFKAKNAHETYRVLKRKNLIVEAVRSSRIITGLYELQKKIIEEEQKDGLNSKCCKKTILRLVNSLSREGLVKMYTTTVIQDKITRKIDLIVHPSVQPEDESVKQIIEQIRFKISSSSSALRLQQAEGKAKQHKTLGTLLASKAPKVKASKRTVNKEENAKFKPTTVPGLGKRLGFQPKMQRLRAIHTFLWYLIYGHPQKSSSTECKSANTTSLDPNGSSSDTNLPDGQAQQDLKETGSSDVSFWDKEKLLDHESNLDFPLNNKVFVDEDSWRRFVPPVRQHEDFSSGWASVGDVLLCMPLSIFLQFTQINYKVDGLEELVNDPMKQHYLVSSLPPKMQRELLYRRKYILMFNENLQRLVYMGLLQFAPTERFKDKDQMFVYLKRNATIVDTTSTEPHYWQVSEPPDKPFERRSYTLNTADDVESYWFDLMCVCLNTPLGVIRSKRFTQEGDPVQSMVYDRYVFAGLAHMLKGSIEVCDDGSIPGDGKGAAGLDSEFFGHLKRNWLWTSHLLLNKRTPTTIKTPQTQNRLKGLLNRDALRIALQAGDGSISCYLTSKRPLSTENVEVGIEPVSRIQQGIGGKGQKRTKVRKEVVKVTRKKRKEPKPRAPAHDEADHRALKMMTKRRVYWTIQEDSVIMLCAVASYLLNSKLKKVYVPYCIVRDLLHAEFQISEDKTSLAVGRRTKYILKNPQTYLNFRICLAEVYQDTTLLKHLEENKPVCPDNPEDCAKSFSEYIRLLRQKFSAVTSALDVIFPDSTQELFSRFKVSAIDDETPVQAKDTINSKEDIHATVLYNLIQSTLAMTNGQMKTSRSFQTFHIYSQYDQELLCKVFLQTRVDRLVNRRRVGQLTGPKKNRSLPILPMSFQLSQSYYRRFLWRFPSSLCTDSFCFLRNLLAKGSEDEKPFTSFYHETENRSQNSEEVLERKTESSRKTKQSDSQEDGGGITRSQKQTADVQKTKEGDDERNKTQSEKSSNDPADSWDALNRADGAPEEPPDVSDMLRFTLNSPGGACAASLSLMSLGLLNVFVSIPKQIVVVDSNLVDNDVAKSLATLEEEDDEDEDDDNDNNVEGRKGLHVTSHQASHTNFLLMRGYCCPGIVHLRNLPTNDYIVVESCIVNLKLRGKPAHHLFSDETPPQLDLTKCGPSLLPSVLTAYIRSPSSSPPSAEECDRHFIEERGYTDEDIEVCTQLRRSLDEAGMNGLDERDLYGAHLQELQPGHTRNLQQYLKDLQEEGQVVRVGSLGVRWVLMQHADPWLLTVNCKQTSRSKFTFERRTSLKSQHSIPSKRKRCHPEQPHRTEEPPAKKQAVEEDKGPGRDDADGLLSNMTEKPGEEKQLEQQRQTAEDGGGDVPQKIDEKEKVQTRSEERRGEEKSPNLEEEGEMQTCPEREKGEDGQEKMETEQKLVRKRTRSSNLDEDGKEEAENVPTESADDERENVSFISRPWRFTDGKVNRPVCKGLLEAILYHIMSLPGVTQQALLEHYKNALQPVVVLDLVQALIELGCVTKKTLVKEPKPSLFARSVCQNKSVTNREEAETVFYEPTISCCLRLCQILPNERLWNDIAS